MGVLIDSMRGKSWILKITLMSIVLGMLLAVSLKTQQRVKSETGVSTTRFPQVAAAFTSAKRENDKLRGQIEELQEKIRDYENELAKGSSAAELLNRELQASKFLAGLSPAEGTGVVVTLQDSRKQPAAESAPSELARLANPWIIHDTDILRVVNELKDAGAEAISVNGERLIAMSEIRCAGNVTIVNGVRLSVPYEIKAIGDPKTLENGLRMREGVVDMFPDTDMIRIETQDRMTIGPFTGSWQPKFAKPVK